MVDQRLVDYIKKNMDQGYSADHIRRTLIAAGWRVPDINEAMSSIRKQHVLEESKLVKKNIISVLAIIIMIGVAGFLLMQSVSSDTASGSIVWQKIGPGAGGAIISSAIQPDNENIIYLGSDVAGIHKTLDGGITWESINNNLASSSYSADIYGIMDIEIDPSDENKITGYKTIYLATWQGIFKTIDGGELWNLIYPENGKKSISSVIVDKNNPSIIYALVGNVLGLTGTSTILKSTNAGSTWTELSGAGIDSSALIFSLLINPKDSSTLYVSTNKGVYESFDLGQTWTVMNTGLPHTDTRELAISETNTGVVLYITLNSHASLDDVISLHCIVYKKIDTEQSWAKACGNLPLLEVYGDRKLIYSDNDLPLNGSYQAGEAEIYSYYKIITHPTNPNIVYTGTFEVYGELKESWPLTPGLFKSFDGGQTWEHVTRTDISLVNGNQAYIDPTLTPAKNVNYGWITAWGMHAAYIEMSKNNPNILVFGIYDAYKTTDAGSTWNQIYTQKINDRIFGGRGLDVTYVYTMDFDPNNEKIIYVGYDDIALWRSKDKGMSLIKFKQFEADDTITNDAVNQIIVDPDNPSIIYITDTNNAEDVGQMNRVGNIYKSTDYGETFAEINSGLPNDITQLVMDKSSGQQSRTLYAAIFRNSIYKTTDNGNSWAEISNGISSEDKTALWRLTIDSRNSQILYAGVNNPAENSKGGIYKTTNAGGTWQKLGLSGPVISIAIDPANSNIIFASTFTNDGQGALYKSEDSGTTWRKVLNQPKVSSVAISPRNSNVVYAASSQWFGSSINLVPGIYKSVDNGDTWTKYSTGIGHGYILFMKINPLDNSIYVGTHGNGLFRGIDNAEPATSLSTSSSMPSGWEPANTSMPVLNVVPCEEGYRTDSSCTDTEWCKVWYRLYCASGIEPTDEEIDAAMNATS